MLNKMRIEKHHPYVENRKNIYISENFSDKVKNARGGKGLI